MVIIIFVFVPTVPCHICGCIQSLFILLLKSHDHKYLNSQTFLCFLWVFCLVFFSLYTTTVGFKSKNRDVIQVQTLSSNSRGICLEKLLGSFSSMLWVVIHLHSQVPSNQFCSFRLNLSKEPCTLEN